MRISGLMWMCLPEAPGSWCSNHLAPAVAVWSGCAAWSPPSPGHPTAACTAAVPRAGCLSAIIFQRSAGSADPSAQQTQKLRRKLKKVHVNQCVLEKRVSILPPQRCLWCLIHLFMLYIVARIHACTLIWQLQMKLECFNKASKGWCCCVYLPWHCSALPAQWRWWCAGGGVGCGQRAVPSCSARTAAGYAGEAAGCAACVAHPEEPSLGKT